MFIKATLAKDLREEDIIRVNRTCPAGRQFQVRGTMINGEIVWLYYETRSGIECPPDEIVGLVYRAYPEGKTEDVMRESVIMEAQALCEFNDTQAIEKAIDRLDEAISAYKLGKKPQE